MTGGAGAKLHRLIRDGSTVAQLAAEEVAALRLMRVLADQIVARLIASSASLP